MLKIYFIFAFILSLFLTYTLYLKNENSKLQSELSLSVNANKELNATLSKVIQRSELEKEILDQKHKEDLKILQKTKDALNYVKNSKDTNSTRLFNDSIKFMR